jgi:L-iditol 2-dehydrogenase
MMALKAMGVSKVYMTDIEEKRLDKALALGADGVIKAVSIEVIEKVRELTGESGCDLVIDAAGSESTVMQALHMTKKGATVVLVGYNQSGMMNLPMSIAINKELTFKTVFRYRHIYPAAIEAIAGGKVNLKDIVTNVFRFDEIQNAMDQCVHNKTEIVKAVVKITD